MRGLGILWKVNFFLMLFVDFYEVGILFTGGALFRGISSRGDFVDFLRVRGSGSYL